MAVRKQTFVVVLLYHKKGETETAPFNQMFLIYLKIKSVQNCDSMFVVRVSHVKLMVPVVVNTTPISCGEDIKNMLFSDVTTHCGRGPRKMDLCNDPAIGRALSCHARGMGRGEGKESDSHGRRRYVCHFLA